MFENRESAAPEVEKEVKDAEPSAEEEDEENSTNGDAAENGEANDKEEENEEGKEKEKKKKKEEKDSTGIRCPFCNELGFCKFEFCPADGKSCTVKRKSAGDAAAEEKPPSEGATPEKKAKLADAESNGKAEVTA